MMRNRRSRRVAKNEADREHRTNQTNDKQHLRRTPASHYAHGLMRLSSLCSSLKRKRYARIIARTCISSNRLTPLSPTTHSSGGGGVMRSYPTALPARFTGFHAKATIAQQAARCRELSGNLPSQRKWKCGAVGAVNWVWPTLGKEPAVEEANPIVYMEGDTWHQINACC